MLAARDTNVVTIVIIPERIIRQSWERLLYNQNAHRYATPSQDNLGILVADVRFQRAT